MKKQVQINGKVEKFQPTTLDQIWGDTGMSKYQTMNSAEYEKQLDNMSFTDIQNHARKIGVFPTDNRTFLIKKLMTEFRAYVNQFHAPTEAKKIEKPVSAEVLKILAEGR